MAHFGVPRTMREIEIWDELVADDDKLKLSASKDFYVNVKNLQNRDNTYKLTFSV